MDRSLKRKLGLAALVVLGVAAIVSFDLLRLWWATRDVEWELNQIVRVADVRPAARVAEIGAGGGRMARLMAERVGPSGRVYATELGDERVAALREAVAAAAPVVDVRPGAPTGTNLPDDCCEVVYMRLVFHHFEDPQAMAADLKRTVAPGGRLAIIDFDSRFGLLSLFEPAGTGGHGISIDEVVRYATAAGFEVAHRDPDFTNRTYLVVFRNPA